MPVYSVGPLKGSQKCLTKQLLVPFKAFGRHHLSSSDIQLLQVDPPLLSIPQSAIALPTKAILPVRYPMSDVRFRKPNVFCIFFSPPCTRVHPTFLSYSKANSSYFSFPNRSLSLISVRPATPTSLGEFWPNMQMY